MQVLPAQEYLLSGKSLEDLKQEFGVNYKIVGDKVSLTYDQIEAKEGCEIASDCRGLILKNGTWETIAVPMSRFYNHGSIHAVDIDWESAAFEDKLDGSLSIIFNHEDKWAVATRSVPDASGQVHDTNYTFATLADMTVADMAKRKNSSSILNHDLHLMMTHMEEKYGKDIRELTFCCELTSPFNRVVCKYEEKNLTLLAARNRRTFEELNPSEFKLDHYGLDTPRLYEFSNLENMLEVIREWDPKEKEGVVIKDKYFNRIKIKNPSYVAFNKLNQSLITSWRGCLEIVLLGRADDVEDIVPEVIFNRIKKLRTAVQKVLVQTRADYEELKNKEIKAFALEAQNRLWPGALFALKRNKASCLEEMIAPKEGENNISNSVLNSMLGLCKKVEPELSSIE